jgi:hypothetical protein
VLFEIYRDPEQTAWRYMGKIKSHNGKFSQLRPATYLVFKKNLNTLHNK